MKKTLRYLVQTVIVACAILVLIWLVLVGAILWKKPVILEKARTEIQERTGGDGTIGDIDVSFFRHFPYLTLHLSKVTLHDSLWQQHHHDLLKAESIDLRFSLLASLFSGKPRVGKVFLEQGSIYLFTDSSGYSNTEMLRSKKPADSLAADSVSAEKKTALPEFSLKDMRFVLEKQDKRKLFDLDIHRLTGSGEEQERNFLLAVSMDLQVKSFAFNIEKGSFLKDKSISGRLQVQWNSGSKILQATRQTLVIDDYPFLISGRFFPAVSPDPFLVSLETASIPYRRAAGLLTPLIQQKLDQYDIDRPISLSATLDAGSADDPTPQISVKMGLHGGSVNTPVGRFTDASFEGSFINEWVHGRKREDENSGIRLVAFSGSWSDIPLKADTINIVNLKRPVLATALQTRFELSKLNSLTGSKSVQFRRGMGTLNIKYRGPLSKNDSTGVSANGSFDIDSAAISYQPYHFLLTDCNGKIRFRQKDLLIDRLEAHAGSSKIVVKGYARNLVSLLDQHPESISMDWILSSPRLDLQDFTTVLGRPAEPAAASKVNKGTGKNSSASAGLRLDELLRDGDIHLQLEAADLLYKKFSGAQAKAELLFSGEEIRLTRMTVAQGSGSLTLSGSLRRSETGGTNPIALQSHIEQADLPGIFTAFSNFGQQALMDRNLKGKLTADIQLTGRMTDKAVLVQKSLKGAINFSVKGGQLLDFEPMEKIQVAVLKKRDLSEIQFSELKSQLDLDSTTLTIHRMEIQSTAFTLFAEGTYDWKSGADMSLQVPLSNLKKDRNPDIPPDNKGTDSKTGISLRLRAKTGEDGKLKVSWDPFRKALKKGLFGKTAH